MKLGVPMIIPVAVRLSPPPCTFAIPKSASTARPDSLGRTLGGEVDRAQPAISERAHDLVLLAQRRVERSTEGGVVSGNVAGARSGAAARADRACGGRDGPARHRQAVAPFGRAQ